MKYKIHYKSSDMLVTDNPIIDIEKDPVVPLPVKNLMIPVINRFKKLGYDFHIGRITEKTEIKYVLNSIFITLRGKQSGRNAFYDLAFWVNYNQTKDTIMKKHIYKEDVFTKKYIPFAKEELKILDTYDFVLTDFFVEETKQSIIDWLDMA
jgi:hypothetical protein